MAKVESMKLSNIARSLPDCSKVRLFMGGAYDEQLFYKSSLHALLPFRQLLLLAPLPFFLFQVTSIVPQDGFRARMLRSKVLMEIASTR
jgi:hypothetical protein